MTTVLSGSLEDYLEAIAELIARDGHAHVKEIAERLNVKMPSVTGALRQLAKAGYILYNTHQPVCLTPEGRAIAERVIHHHEVLKQFFSAVLNLPAEEASGIACRVEHLVHEEAIERFRIFSEAISGRSDARSLQIYLTEAMNFLGRPDHRRICVLSELRAGESGVVELFGRNLSTREQLPFDVGECLTVQSLALDDSSRTLSAGARTILVTLAEAENIWVKRQVPRCSALPAQ